MSAKKYDSGKPKMSLVPSAALLEVGKVMTFGCKKYGPHNWKEGMDHSRLIDANLRHLMAYVDGEDIDPESGLSHLAHACANSLMLLESRLKEYGYDDRYIEDDFTDEEAMASLERQIRHAE